jgi:small conductance mechanosensitive channel
MENITNIITNYAIQYGIKVIGAALIFIIGRLVAKFLTGIIKKIMSKAKVEPTLSSFLGDLTYIGLIVLVILASLSTLGIKMTSFVAIVGAATLAIGLALQNNLSNIGAGVVLMLFRPFKVADFVEIGGVSGTVEKISLFNTELKTPDNKAIIVPNSNILGNNITNYSAKDTRRIDLVIGIGYDDDIKLAKETLNEILTNDKRILKDPPPTIAVAELADSSVNFAVRPWVKSSDYWDVYFDLLEKIKLTFDEKGIGIPYPQMDVHVKKED